MKNIICTIILTTLITSCSSKLELSTNEAMEILKTEFQETCTSRRIVTTISPGEKRDYNKYNPTFQKLKKDGYIDIKSKTQQIYSMRITSYTLIPKSKFNEEFKLNNEYIAGKVEINEILGVSVNQENKTAKVLFEYSYEPTAIANICLKECKKGNIKKEVELIKYDTGWKLKQ